MRKSKTRSVICVVLVLASLLLVFAGCGKKKEGSKKGDDGDKLSVNSDYVYIPELVNFPSDIGDMYNVTGVGDKLFFISNIPVRMSDGTRLSQSDLEQIQKQWDEYYSSVEMGGDTPVAEPDIEDYEYKSILCSINRDGTGYTELPDFVPTEPPSKEDGYANVDNILGGGDGSLWVVERISEIRYNLPSGFDPETEDKWEYYDGENTDYYFRSISETGAELASIRASDMIDLSNVDYFYLHNVAADKDGNILFSDDNSNVYCVTKTGEFGFKLALEGDSWINSFAPLRDGRYAASYYQDDGYVLRVIDTASKSWGDTIKAPRNAWNYFKGNGDYDFYYDVNGSLMGYNTSTEESDLIINWVNSDMNSDSINFVDVKENGDIFVISNYYDSDTGSYLEVANMKKTPKSEAPQKKSITLAVVYLDYDLRRAVVKFNKANTDVHIDIKDYSVYATDEDYNAGVTKLNTEIISGNIPDIISIDQLPYKQYAAKGLLEDLYSYIDSDSEFSRDDFMPSILKAMESDGKLNYVSPSFNVMTLIGSSDVLGPETGWTMKELKDILDRNPQADCAMGQAMSREQVFQQLFIYGIDSYINWTTGECFFDSEDFKALLEFSKSFPVQDSFDYENMEWQNEATLIAEGRQIVSNLYLYDFDSYNYNTYAYGDKVVNKGIPMAENGGAIAYMSYGLAMTKSCSEKDAAWSFMRTLLTEEYQEGIWELPTNKNVFEKKLADAMKQEYYIDENGDRQPQSHGGVVLPDGTEMDFYAVTEEQAAAIRGIIDSVRFTADYNESILNIIQDETAAFFNGEKSVDETAAIIQSRMSIYVNEQR